MIESLNGPLEESEEVRDGKADFLVSRAVVSSGGESIVCSFDVRPDFFMTRMNRGTAELMERFVRAVGVPFDTVARWVVEPMCTPFYGYTTDVAEWRDRVAEAWRVSVELSGATDHDLRIAPQETWYLRGWDSTVTEDSVTPGFWAGDAVDGVVIADCHAATVGNPRDVVEKVAARFPEGQVRVSEFPCPPFSPLLEVRILLPGLRLPADLHTIQSAVAVCEGLGMTTHESFAWSFAQRMESRATLVALQPQSPPDTLLATLNRFSEQPRMEPLSGHGLNLDAADDTSGSWRCRP